MISPDNIPGPLPSTPSTVDPSSSRPRSMTPKATSAAVSAYHQNLSSHLLSMLRSVQIDAASPNHTPVVLPTVGPANQRTHKRKSLIETAGRKGSDDSATTAATAVSESMLGTSQRGSATTVDDAGSASVGTGTGMGGVGSGSVPSRQSSFSGMSRNGIETSGASATIGEVSVQADNGSVEVECESEEGIPPEFTAKPEKVVQLQSTSSAVYQTQPRRRDSAPPHAPSSRDEEHRLAWQAEGKKVWRKMPDGFALRLDVGEGGSRRRKSAETGSRHEKMVGHQQKHRSSLDVDVGGEGVGLGLRLARNETRGSVLDDEAAVGGRRDSRVTKTDGSSHGFDDRNHDHDHGTTSGSITRSPIPRSTAAAASFAPPKHAHHNDPTTTSTTQQPTSPRPFRSHHAPSTQIYQDKKAEYELKRLARLEKRRADIHAKISAWSYHVGISLEGVEVEVPEIKDTPPSPRIRPTTTTTATGTPTQMQLPIQSLPRLAPLPLPNPAVYTFGGKQQPLFLIPPTPAAEERGPETFLGEVNSNSALQEGSKAPKAPGKTLRSKADIADRLRTLEALMGYAPPSAGKVGREREGILMGEFGTSSDMGEKYGERADLDVTIRGRGRRAS